MNAIDIEKLNQLISRTDISGNDKVRWLEDFISGRELQQQERSYSEEEVENLIRTTYEETMRAMVDWFTNNKDKTPQDAESAIDNYVYPKLAQKGIKFKKK